MRARQPGCQIGPRVMRWRGEITTNHKGPFSLESTLREHSLNAFLIRATSQRAHTHTHTSFFRSDFSVLFAYSSLHITVFDLLLRLLHAVFSALLWVCWSSLLIIVQSACV